MLVKLQVLYKNKNETILSVNKSVYAAKKNCSAGKKTVNASVPITPDDMTRKMQILEAMSLKSGPYKPVATTITSPMKS